MSCLTNDNDNIYISLSPKLKDNFGIKCALNIKTELLTLDFENVSDTEKYMSYKNIEYIENKLLDFDKLIADTKDEELIFNIYPIDVFFMMDIYKSCNSLLLLSLKIPIGVYTNSRITGYNIGLEFFVTVENFKLFLKNFIEEYEILKNK